MNWIGIGVGAAAGVVAVLVSVGIMKILGRSATTKGAAILNIVIFFAALTIGREVVEPRIQAQRVEAALLEIPIYRALQQHEPDAYVRIRTAIRDGVARKLPKEQIWSSTRPVIGEVMGRRLPHTSDEAIVRFGHHIVSTMTVLHSKGGNACFYYINPTAGQAVDFNSLLGKETVEQELSILADVVVSASGKSLPKVTEAEAAPDLEAVVGRLLMRFSQDDMALLRTPNESNPNKRRYCEVLTALYAEASALPSPNSARLLRYLSQGQ